MMPHLCQVMLEISCLLLALFYQLLDSASGHTQECLPDVWPRFWLFPQSRFERWSCALQTVEPRMVCQALHGIALHEWHSTRPCSPSRAAVCKS